MVPSSTIDIAADGERLMWGRFSLGKTVHLGNFEFTADYFGGLSFHGLNSQRGINRKAGYDRVLHRGVPHDAKQGKEL
jgi:hypothetical protein